MPDLLAIRPSKSAANRNHGVSLAKPPNATLKRTTPSAQNKKQPIRPAMAKSMTCEIQASTMNDTMASPCWVCGSNASGENQIAGGTTMHAANARVCEDVMDFDIG